VIVLEIERYLIAYDTIISILDTVKFGCRTLTTKEQLLKALNEMILVSIEFEEIRTVRFHIDALRFSVKPVEDMPDGTVADEIKNCVTNGIRAVQRAIGVAFYTDYYEKDIGEYAETCPDLLRNIIADVMLGDYRLGGATV
jgi:hypothetical protein